MAQAASPLLVSKINLLAPAQAHFEKLAEQRFGRFFSGRLERGARFIGLLLFGACQKLGAGFSEERGLELVRLHLDVGQPLQLLDSAWRAPSRTFDEFVDAMLLHPVDREAYVMAMREALRRG